MKQRLQLFLASVFLVFVLTEAAQAQLPDAVRFGIRMELGDIDQARAWLDEGLPPDFLADRIGSGLMIAAWEGNIPLMELFLARGADINKRNAAGEQALLHAAWRGQLEAVKWLLAHGAELNRPPLQWTALHYAVFAGHDEVVDYLTGRGADVNARSSNGSSVLMMAVYEGREEMVQKLLGLGADPRIKNERGDGALEWAMRYQRLGIARLVSGPQQFAAAANQAKAYWGEAGRSLPAGAGQGATAAKEIERLLSVRSHLAARGMSKAVDKVDRQIAALRAKPVLDKRPAAILEISASRASPRQQKARLISERRTD